jgi:hypothetical protein
MLFPTSASGRRLQTEGITVCNTVKARVQGRTVFPAKIGAGLSFPKRQSRTRLAES